jgi:hypothetical protein
VSLTAVSKLILKEFAAGWRNIRALSKLRSDLKKLFKWTEIKESASGIIPS